MRPTLDKSTTAQGDCQHPGTNSVVEDPPKEPKAPVERGLFLNLRDVLDVPQEDWRLGDPIFGINPWMKGDLT
jgi:hypothetical protein